MFRDFWRKKRKQQQKQGPICFPNPVLFERMHWSYETVLGTKSTENKASQRLRGAHVRVESLCDPL